MSSVNLISSWRVDCRVLYVTIESNLRLPSIIIFVPKSCHCAPPVVAPGLNWCHVRSIDDVRRHLMATFSQLKSFERILYLPAKSYPSGPVCLDLPLIQKYDSMRHIALSLTLSITFREWWSNYDQSLCSTISPESSDYLEAALMCVII